jgi:hypothetical protein
MAVMRLKLFVATLPNYRKILVVRKFATDPVYCAFTYIHTYHSRFIPEGVAETSQIFLRDAHVLPTLVSYEEHCRRDRW